MHSKSSYKDENSEYLTQSRTHDQHNPTEFLTNYATILDDENQKTENMNLIKVHKKWM